MKKHVVSETAIKKSRMFIAAHLFFSNDKLAPHHGKHRLTRRIDFAKILTKDLQMWSPGAGVTDAVRENMKGCTEGRGRL